MFKRRLFCTPPTHEDAREVLILARNLIVDEDNWVGDRYLKVHEDGHESYCAMTALGKAAKQLGWPSIPPAATTVLDEISSEWGCGGIISLNDNKGHIAVLNAFTSAIIALTDEGL